MLKILLRDAIEDIRFEDLPPSWNSFDLETFSKSKNLWDYQQRAVENGVRYYADILKILQIIKAKKL
jgi:type III restriction enzyme